MSEPAPAPPLPPPPLPDGRPPRRLVMRLARSATELFTVFIGVYAAFLLNNYQSHRQERQRREQILAWLESEYTESLTDVRQERADIKRQADDFNHRLAAGEMPPLHPFNWITDYDPSDMASMLGGGGFGLLEVETVREIKGCENTLRSMLGIVRHDQQLSDAMLLPNVDKDRSFFYDPATHQLRPGFAWYIEFYDRTVQNYGVLQPKVEKLLTQIRAERRRNH